MKTRNGFVSNSSSSSFVILGNRLDAFYSIESKDVDGGIIYCRGDEFGEGFDFFKVTPKIFEFLKRKEDSEVMSRLSFYKVYVIFGESGSEFDKGKLIKALEPIPNDVRFNTEIIDKSFHSSSSVADIRKIYFIK